MQWAWQEEDVKVPTKFVFFVPIEKRKWLPLPLIGWDIFDFSETAERNSTKLDRVQDPNVLYLVCDFRPIGKTKWPHWNLIGWSIFDFSKTTERNSTKLDGKQDLNVLYQVCAFLANRKNKMDVPASDWLRLFRLLLWNRQLNSTKLDRKQGTQTLYQVFIFRADRKNNMGPASDWLRYFWLLIGNFKRKFKDTWQEAISQRPLGTIHFILHDVISPWGSFLLRQSKRIFWNRTIKQNILIESLFNRLLHDIIFSTKN